MTSDFLLIQKIKNGDSSAAARLVEKYYASIYQYCFLHIRDRYLAEDMAQETFVRFFEAVVRYGQYILGKPANGLGNRAIYQPAAS